MAPGSSPTRPRSGGPSKTAMPSSSSSSRPQANKNGKSKGKFSMRPASSMAAPIRGSGVVQGQKRARFDRPARAGKDGDDDDDEEEDGDDDDDMDASAGETGTDEEIEKSMDAHRKSDKTAKRKRRAVSPTAFGEALDAFLGGGVDAAVATEEPLSDGEQVGKGETKAESSTATQKKVTPSTVGSTSKPPSSAPAPIFALAPSVAKRISSSTLTAKASRVALEERKARDEQWRVRDVIGSWGRPGQKPTPSTGGVKGAADSDADDDVDDDQMDEAAVAWSREGGSKGHERRLRKVAQRGVVKLFNAIRAAQSTTVDDVEDKNKDRAAAEASARRGQIGKATETSVANQATIAGRNALGGKSRELADLSKSNFLDLIRSSGSGSGSMGAAGAAAAAAKSQKVKAA